MSSNKLKLNRKQRGEIADAFVMLTQIGITITVSILIGLFIGRFLDGLLGTSPLFLFIFIILGTVSAFRSIYIITVKKWK